MRQVGREKFRVGILDIITMSNRGGRKKTVEQARTVVEPGRTVVEPGLTVVEPGPTAVDPDPTVLEQE